MIIQNNGYTFISLDRVILSQNIDSFLRMDQQFLRLNVLDIWEPSNYLDELPDKWALSFAAFNKSELVAYRISSGRQKILNYAHTHRSATKINYQRKNIATILWQYMSREAISLGYDGITTYIDSGNENIRKMITKYHWKGTNVFNKDQKQLWKLDFQDTHLTR